MLPRPRRDIAPPREPNVLVILRVTDDFLERIDEGNPRDQIGVGDDVHHGRIFIADPVAVVELVFKFFEE